MKPMSRLHLLSFLLLMFLLVGCPAPPAAVPPAPSGDPIAELIEKAPPPAARKKESPSRSRPIASAALSRMGYTVQVGAFSSLDNAVRLEKELTARGIDAYYFLHDSGLYKVRFGNYPDYQPARLEAERLQQAGLIGTFFIVFPDDHTAARIVRTGQGDLREELVRTARRFIGVPYRWGGEDRKNGFDCSGLTMVCYRLNGLDLPRNSRSQFDSGRWVPKGDLKKGDLVFFATRGGKRVSHVGMYIGDGLFIHAPRTGQKVRIEKMSNAWFAKRYMGGRSYM